MDYFTRCPRCSATLRAGRPLAGAFVRCTACRAEFTVPTVVAAVPVADPIPVAELVEEVPEVEPVRPALRLTPRREERSGLVWVAAVAGVAVVAIVGLVWWAERLQHRRPDTDGLPEGAEQRREEVVRAFRDKDPQAVRAVEADLQNLFDDLGAALSRPDPPRIIGHFDVERMLDEFVAQQPLPAEFRRDRSRAVSGMMAGLGETLDRQSQVFRWDRSEVRHLQWLSDHEAVVIARHHQRGNPAALKIRWWVIYRQDRWRVFDLEELDGGMRMSIFVGSAFGGNAEMGRAARLLADAMRRLSAQDDPAAVEKALADLPRRPLPVTLQAYHATVLGIIRGQQGRFAEAMEQYARARRLRPDVPLLDKMEATAHNRLRQWPEAHQRVEAYRALLGDDALILEELGEALRGLGRRDEAADAYRRSLDEDPTSTDAFLGLVQSLGPGARRDDLAGRFARLDRPAEQFPNLAEACVRQHDADALEALAQAMTLFDARAAGPHYYLGIARLWAGRFKEAAAALAVALRQEQDRAKRKTYLEGFFRAATRAERTREAYAAADGVPEAFTVLARQLHHFYDNDDLRWLIRAHAARHPDDSQLPFYRAVLLVQAGRYAEADAAFTRAAARPADPTFLAEFRGDRVLARYHAAGALAAYAAFGPEEETFEQLVNLCQQDDRPEVLKQLVAAHARKAPQSPTLLRTRIQLLVRDNQAADAIGMFQQAVAKQPEADRNRLVHWFLSEMAERDKAVEAYRAAPDPKQAFMILAGNLQRRRQFDGLRQLIAAHRRRHPNATELASAVATLYAEEKAWDHAAKALSDGLKAGDDDAAGLRYRYLTAMYRAGRGLQAYREAPPALRDQTFTQLAHLLVADKKATELAALVAAHRPHAGDSGDLWYFEGQARLLAGRPAEAVPLLQRAYQAYQRPYQNHKCVTALALGLEAAGKGLDGYRAAPDKRIAFTALAARLVEQKKADLLQSLIDIHAKAHPDDEALPAYRGELYLLRGKAAEADQVLSAAWARARARPPRNYVVRGVLMRARIGSGRVVSIYEELGATGSVRDALAQLCVADKNAGQLRALLDARRREWPDDPGLPRWEVKWHWLRQDYAGALKVLTEQRETLRAPRFGWDYEETLVRCLLKLGRSKDALREAQALAGKRDGNAMPLVFVYASAGDVKQVMGVLEKYRSQIALLRHCYDDEELGPILRGPRFQPFRDRFPEPAPGALDGLEPDDD